MKLTDIFKKALSPFTNKSDSKTAYSDLDQGKKINLNMRSDRYTYNNKEDNNYDKSWTPKTDTEKKTLSPEGYYRQGDRENEKKARMSSIYNSALSRAKQEDQKRVDDLKAQGKNARKTSSKKLEGQAQKEAEEEFGKEFNEKQISVPSTAIKNIKYDPETELLQVQFTSGNTTYDYPGVPLEEVQGLLKANSKGEYFMQNIHDQYSLYGKDHSPKNGKQRSAIKKYVKSYMKNNKNNWMKAAKDKVKNAGKE